MSVYLVKLKILLCPTTIFAVFAEVSMCKTFKRSILERLIKVVLMFAMFVSRIKQNKLFFTSIIKSTIVQVSNRRLDKR